LWVQGWVLRLPHRQHYKVQQAPSYHTYHAIHFVRKLYIVDRMILQNHISRAVSLAASCACWPATPVWRMRTADSVKDNPGSMRPLGRLDNGEKPGHWGASGKCHAFARHSNYGLGSAGFVGQSFTTLTLRSSLRTAGFSAVRSTPLSTSLINGRHPMRSSSG